MFSLFQFRKQKQPDRTSNGTCLNEFPEDFTVLDLETTGLNPSTDSIIEVAALRVRGGVVVDSFSSFVRPNTKVDEYITELTGITNEMLFFAPKPKKVFPEVRDFISDDIVLGHNVRFDINFLHNWFSIIMDVPFDNNYIDTLRISKKALPNLSHHKLKDVAAALDVVPSGAHRAINDCQTTFDCYCKLRDIVFSEQELMRTFKNRFCTQKTDENKTKTENTDFNELHPYFSKVFVFSGSIENMSRMNASQAVVDVGGICENNITKKTNFYVLGNTEYWRLDIEKSTKRIKAEEYRKKGVDIEIIPENVFYELLKS